MRAAIEPPLVNGLDVGRLYGTADAFHCDPGLARFVFRARNRWLEGTRSQSQVLSFHGAGVEQRGAGECFLLDCDCAPVLFGEDHAPSPQEYLLHALAACLTITLVAQAATQGLGLDAVECAVEAELDLSAMLTAGPPTESPIRRIDAAMVVCSQAEPDALQAAFDATRQRSPLLGALSVPVRLAFRIRS